VAKKKRNTSPNVAAFFTEGTVKGARLAAEHVLKVSNRSVPLEDKDLAQSGRVSSSGTTAAVSYHSPYALKQHEDQRLKHEGGRTPKFLENAFLSEKREILEIIAKEIREELK